FTLLENGRFHPGLRRMAAFDVVANNADRKGGHCLVDGEGRLWGIDHGLCFNDSPKLRTVIWDFAGEAVAEGDLEDLRRLVADGPGPALESLLSGRETAAMTTRAAALTRRGCLPEPRTDHPYPWPLV
ncbi:MAG: SCO1664 family protein, partial [Actinomycetes bacterium]